MTDLVIFDFDGTMFDTRAAIEHAAALTFSTLLPSYEIPRDKARRLMASGVGLSETFRALHPDETFDEDTWVATYRQLYTTHEGKFTKPFPGLQEVLEGLKARGIPIAIVSNKVVPAIRTTLERMNLSGYFHETLIIGDRTPGSEKKPDPTSYTEVLVPRFKRVHGDGVALDPAKVLMVGDTIADLEYARNIGAKVCWCRFGQGDREECGSFQPDYTVDSLSEVLDIVAKQ
ncbi:HAD family hydrolase [Aspergillus clavatus NRRL 1]|uniref:Phosphoglycolate phosphatase, putative n=1 Tax=Aspergillus clavatus (strain ATCC 1007 / CBS 513.65 / DSM 816 / NCTC 3887 / NRRL 1 / QM 1276 / 107) TaxID=344612 RepID=A1CGI3_ASPCL|nr:phosphoglycolate phosphatase, putative [Aspergillus clavatus NRRL 1]EAW11063.1 phosphoglycolate phosphatase, putative [Aspergillus clavatus NRRL 1]